MHPFCQAVVFYNFVVRAWCCYRLPAILSLLFHGPSFLLLIGPDF